MRVSIEMNNINLKTAISEQKYIQPTINLKTNQGRCLSPLNNSRDLVHLPAKEMGETGGNE